MTAKELEQTVNHHAPPAGLPPLVEAMWWQAHGDWEKAHLMAQDVPEAAGAWVHAYLHRAEGEPGNAAYWYEQAGRPMAQSSLQEEWFGIVRALLSP
ncbi:MAG TPA: hypothetical protein VGD62_02280 [Acidobacteriaceae bacterium]